MSRKIAPQLSALVTLEIHTRDGGLIGMKAAAAELRALLAVARAAQRLELRVAAQGQTSHENALARALARLSPRPERRGGR